MTRLVMVGAAILCLAAACSGDSTGPGAGAPPGATVVGSPGAIGPASETAADDPMAAPAPDGSPTTGAARLASDRQPVLVATVPDAVDGEGSSSVTTESDPSAPSTTADPTTASSTGSSTGQPDATGSTTAPATTAPSSTTSSPPGTATTGSTSTTSLVPSADPTNPIAVPAGLFGGVATSGPARCIFADLQSVPVQPNPGYVGESVDGQSITGDELWGITFFLMLYSNCERQARGLEPFRMYPTDKQLAMQQTVLGISESHGGFGDRADIAGGLAAEGHGGGPRPGEPIDRDNGEDTNGDGVWSVDEIGRRSASGNRNNGNAGLVDHGNAMIDPTYTCIFAAASLGPTADHRVDVIIFYGNRC